MSDPFLARLSIGPLLCDGAMGTLLHQRGYSIDGCFDALNLSRREAVLQVHRDYVAAGADIIETNTFGANRFKLAPHGFGDQVREINFRGAKIASDAREISGRPVLIAGSIGPTGRAVVPYGLIDPEGVRAAFREQAGALLEGGVDLLMIETIGSIAEMRAAVLAARDICELPIVAQMTYADDGRTVGGHAPADVVAELADLDIAVLGINCSVGPRHVVEVLRELRAAAPDSLWLSGQPNAGWPMQVGDRMIYPSSSDYFGEYVANALEAGARIVGGCCGTTPEHIATMRTVLNDRREVTGLVEPVRQRPRSVDLLPPEAPTRLAGRLGREFVVSVELDPPRGLTPTKALAGARLLREAGVEFVNVADSPMARVRMSAQALCFLIQTEVGLETILHFTTRDRNLMGLQSDLLGAHALGVRNIIALTGDPPSLGDYPNATAVYDIDSTGLTKVLASMNEGSDASGAPIGQRASFTIAVAADPTRDDLQHEADRLQRKLSAGAHFVMTQPVYALATWRRFVAVYEARHGPIGVPVVLGIMPLQSSRHAEFLHNEVPGIRLTEDARERMRRAGSQGRTEGVLMARELLLEAAELVQGVYVMPSFHRYEVAIEVLEALPNAMMSRALSR